MNEMTARINGSLSDPDGNSRKGHFVVYALLCILPLSLGWNLTSLVASTALTSDTYTYIPLIPLVSVFLIYAERKRIFSHISYDWLKGLAIFIPGAFAIGCARFNFFQLQPSNQLSLVVLGFVFAWIGAFALSWGTVALRASRFPLLFLVFMIPIPEPLLSNSVAFLQVWSANATALFFNIFGLPYLRNDLIFSLPGIAIRVAEECSGIRSTLALLIMTALASHLFLKTTWKQILICLIVVPLSIVKNGLRIATLSALAVYVDGSFLTGPIHHKFGGMLFFGAAFIPLVIVLRYLKKTDDKRLTDNASF